MSPVQVSIFSARGWKGRSPPKVAALRELLSDGRKHSQHALQKVGGMRFGARLFDLHNETDLAAGLAPLHYERIQEKSGDAQVFYRMTDKANCSVCSKEDRRKPSEVIEAQAKRIAELETLVRRLETRLACAEGA